MQTCPDNSTILTCYNHATCIGCISSHQFVASFSFMENHCGSLKEPAMGKFVMHWKLLAKQLNMSYWNIHWLHSSQSPSQLTSAYHVIYTGWEKFWNFGVFSPNDPHFLFSLTWHRELCPQQWPHCCSSYTHEEVLKVHYKQFYPCGAFKLSFYGHTLPASGMHFLTIAMVNDSADSKVIFF